MKGTRLSNHHEGNRIFVEIGGKGAASGIRLGRYQYAQARHGLKPHHHENAMEICYMASGSQTYEVEDQFFTLRGGDIFVTFPYEWHSTGGFPEEKGMLYWLLLPMDEEPFLGLPTEQAAALYEALLDLSSRHFRGNREMRNNLDTIIALSESPEPDVLTAMRSQTQLVAFLLSVIECAEQPASDEPSALLAEVLAHIDDHLAEELPLADLADLAGLSLSRFKTRFKRELGMPPGAYIARRRIDAAKDLLQHSNRSITHIAFDLGFSSSQYFATVFKRYTGTPPSQWRAKDQA